MSGGEKGWIHVKVFVYQPLQQVVGLVANVVDLKQLIYMGQNLCIVP